MDDIFKFRYRPRSIGEKIEEVRKAQNKTQSDVAKDCMLSRQTIADLEHGDNVGIHVLHMVCASLGYEIELKNKEEKNQLTAIKKPFEF